MEVNADSSPLLLSVYLPVLTSLLRRAEPLWSWYGTVALRGCRLGLLHPRGAPPLRLDIPPLGSHSRAQLMKTVVPAFLFPRRSLQLSRAFSLSALTSSTLMIQSSDRASGWRNYSSFLLWCWPWCLLPHCLVSGRRKNTRVKWALQFNALYQTPYYSSCCRVKGHQQSVSGPVSHCCLFPLSAKWQHNYSTCATISCSM